MKKAALIISALLAVPSASAEIIKIPKESGFSGFFLGGVAYSDYSSNLFKGQSDSNETHNGLDKKPKNRSKGTPLFGVDLRYTFADTRTQIFFGNLIQDAVQFDFTQQLGVRQEIGNKGIVGLSYVFPLLPTETWSDPYASGKRDDTDMKSGGARLSWDKIWDSNFNASLTVRKFDIDEENSGASLSLSDSDRDLLDRNGNSTSVSVSYNWILSPTDIVSPELTYGKVDLDGEAMAQDRTSARLTYIHIEKAWALSSNVFAGTVNYDKANPVFGKKADADEFGINASFFLNNIFGVEHLTSVTSASYSVSDSDIDFFKQDVNSVSTALLYQF